MKTHADVLSALSVDQYNKVKRLVPEGQFMRDMITIEEAIEAWDEENAELRDRMIENETDDMLYNNQFNR
jgi:predicted nucleotidyltransferase